jgi:hypothetical protein
MKSIANQYRDLKEGKMSQQNFMRNLRMTMPQFVTNVTSFGDAVRILKNKSIIVEAWDSPYDGGADDLAAMAKAEKPESKFDFNKAAIESATGDKISHVEYDDEDEKIYWSTKNPYVNYYIGGDEQIIKYDGKTGERYPIGDLRDYDEPRDDYEPDTDADYEEPRDDFDMAEGEGDKDELDAMVKKMEDEKAGEEAVKSQYDLEETADAYDIEKAIRDEKIDPAQVRTAAEKAMKGDPTDLALLMINAGNLFEAKKKEDKVEYSKNQVNPTELRLGIRTELECDSDMELDKAKEIAYKNITKDPIYYTKLKLSGVEAHPKKVKGEKEVPAKKKKEAIQLVDLVNGMQKVKMPKKDEKKKLKEGVDEAMPFADLPADPGKYKIVKDSKGYIIKATNADGVEFQKGDTVKTYDGEEIKIAKFEESQGKVKAIYSTGMFFKGIDIDGLEAPKPTMRPGVDMGASFEKMKKSMQEIVRETISEYFDGRDNLINPLSAEDENN